MADGIEFFTDKGLIDSVELAIQLSFICQSEYDKNCQHVWCFFETLMGVNTAYSSVVPRYIIKLVEALTGKTVDVGRLRQQKSVW